MVVEEGPLSEFNHLYLWTDLYHDVVQNYWNNFFCNG